MKTFKDYLKRSMRICLVVLLSFGFTACENEILDIEESDETLSMKNKNGDGPFPFEGTVFDIASTPDGSIMVGVNQGESRSVQLIKNGKVSTMIKVPSTSDINGLAPIGAGNAFLSTAGGDQALVGALYRVSRGNARMVADLAAFERERSPDALEGPQWKKQICEGIDGFTPGPQNNPYKIVATSGNTAVVADAAGNTVLKATTTGDIDWLAILTPPVDKKGEWMVRWKAGEEEDIPCYVQPVPTGVAVDDEGYIYVGELTGNRSEADGEIPIGISRVWKIAPGATNVVCDQTNPSSDCELLIDGLTSVIDLEIGPDGLLYVVEFDGNSWFAGVGAIEPKGGTISSYDLDGNPEKVVASNLSFPSAIAFDKQGSLWVLENNAIPDKQPIVRMLK